MQTAKEVVASLCGDSKSKGKITFTRVKEILKTGWPQTVTMSLPFGKASPLPVNQQRSAPHQTISPSKKPHGIIVESKVRGVQVKHFFPVHKALTTGRMSPLNAIKRRIELVAYADFICAHGFQPTQRMMILLGFGAGLVREWADELDIEPQKRRRAYTKKKYERKTPYVFPWINRRKQNTEMEIENPPEPDWDRLLWTLDVTEIDDVEEVAPKDLVWDWAAPAPPSELCLWPELDL